LHPKQQKGPINMSQPQLIDSIQKELGLVDSKGNKQKNKTINNLPSKITHKITANPNGNPFNQPWN
jgi:hypothetical protein